MSGEFHKKQKQEVISFESADKKIENVTAAILCGGKSRRMGFDKAFLMEDEQYLLLQTAGRLQSLFEQVVLVSNTKAKFVGRTDFTEFRILEDHYMEKGPMGGISTVLEQVQTEYVFIMACDMPLPDIGLIGRMYRKLEEEQVLVCSHQGKLEPLLAFYHKSCLPVFKKQMEIGELKPRSAFPALNVGLYCLSDTEINAIVNLNTPEDVQNWNQKTIKK
ncbi:molybdenum cofactor guanylyltransferase [Lacrimispora sphenoides]|jgi:molybdopterin-guanine dinucleotide biosynthesis protein A|uniref:molybdenum cofactor guanylyltransferase n=1 Tax=Lacrimispora sphenoides TaxID=29370 RepID=UPI0008D0109D|nr:molybdenum cofactor guanylyltransferase [Lacrimispora sphenoides]SEU01379.1 molybdenum cofactor guanylyltransferase [Lacrimispora sphenoides]